MHPFDDNPLTELARRARSGDPAAAEAFRREMSVALEGMVRLALRKRICFSPFEEYARAQADRLQESSGGQLPDDELARRTAGRVCQEMIDRLQAGSRVQDTVPCVAAGGSSKYQTVVSSPRSVVSRK
jgi:hypothetical protein